MVNLKLTVVLLFMLLAVGCSTPPSDKSMEDKFRSHEADFNKLVGMMKEDAKLDSVDETAAYLPSNQTGSRPKAEISPQRMDEYRRLLKQTDVKNIFRHKDAVHFVMWRGWYGIDPSNSQAKDYLFVETPPSTLVDSLEQTDKLPQDKLKEGIYKRIADNWYLEYSIVE